jgi:hypothetical protein
MYTEPAYLNLANGRRVAALGGWSKLIVLSTLYDRGPSIIGGGVIPSRNLARRRISPRGPSVVRSVVRGRRDLGLATVCVGGREREVGSRAEPGTSVAIYGSEDCEDYHDDYVRGQEEPGQP